MRIAFFRNVQNYNQLCHKTDTFRGIFAECQIIDTIELGEKDYNAFCCNFMRSYNYLSHYTHKAIIRNDIWFGVLVRCSDKGVMVVMNGYQYPRYVGLMK